MKTGLGFSPVDKAFPFEGIDASTPAVLLPAGYSPKLLNLKTFRGVLSERPGYNQGLTLSGVSDPVIALIPFSNSSGVNQLLVATKQKLFLFNETTTVLTEIKRNVRTASFSELSAGNGWSNSNLPPLGSFVWQGGTVDAPNAVGQYYEHAGGIYLFVVVEGVFDATSDLVPFDTTYGSFVLTGTDPLAVSKTVVKFLKLVYSPTADVTAGGTGYAVNDILTVSGGSFTTPAKFKVTAVAAGIVTAVVNATVGAYSTGPGNPASTSGGSGSGCTLTINWGKGWTLDGNITPGDPIYQGTSLAVGVWLPDSDTYFYAQVVSGTFTKTNDIFQGVLNTVTGRDAGRLTATNNIAGAAGTFSASYAYTALNDLRFCQGANLLDSPFIDYAEYNDLVLGKLLVLTNGADPPVYFDGTSIRALPINIGGFKLAKTVTTYKGYLIFGNLNNPYISTGLKLSSNGVVWCDSGNAQEWVLGQAGDMVLGDSEGEILRFLLFQERLLVVSRQSLGTINYIDPAIIFGYARAVEHFGALGHRAVVVIGQTLVLVAHDSGLLAWDGSTGTYAMDDQIRPEWMGSYYQLCQTLASLFYDPVSRRVYFSVPTGQETQRVFVLEFETGHWKLQQIHSAFRWSEEGYFHWVTAWGSYGYNGTLSGDLNASPLVTLIGTSDGYVFRMNTDFSTTRGDVSSANAAENISFEYQSPDLTAQTEFESSVTRWIELELEILNDTTVAVEYSDDHGVTWTTAGTVPTSSTLKTRKVLFDVSARLLRFRLTSTGTKFKLSWYRAWYRAGGPR